jgi:hypothetical protein
MAHKHQVGQTVVPSVYIREFAAVYTVTSLMPDDVTGAPQYRLRNTTTGREMVFREFEIRPYASNATPVGRF